MIAPSLLAPLLAPLLAIVVGIVLVRLGWAGRPGAVPLGWTLALAALVLLAAGDGAWGLAVGTTTGVVAGLALVLHAGWTSPARIVRPPREAPAIHVPHHARDILRRCAVFALVVPVAFAAAQGLAFGIQAVARSAGWNDTDTTVLALFLQPVLWTAIMAVQMTRADASRMVAPPAAAALAGVLLWTAA